MSLQVKILNLISGIDDPSDRMYISSTINYISQLYADGHITESEVRDSLYEIFIDVLKAKNPELIEEEVKKKAKELVEEFIRAFRLESIARRTYARFRPSLTSRPY